jgi:hypothetical protein
MQNRAFNSVRSDLETRVEVINAHYKVKIGGSQDRFGTRNLDQKRTKSSGSSET